MGAAFANYAPHFTGPISPEDSVNYIVAVVSRQSSRSSLSKF